MESRTHCKISRPGDSMPHTLGILRLLAGECHIHYRIWPLLDFQFRTPDNALHILTIFRARRPRTSALGRKRSPFLKTRVPIPLLESLARAPGDAPHAQGGRDHIKGARGPHQYPPNMHPSSLERRWTNGPHLIPGPNPPDTAAFLRLT